MSLWRFSLIGVLVACTTHNGKTTLVRVDAESPGGNCEYGGVAIQSGVDADKNGMLEDAEISSTQYVCNGATTVTCGEGTKVDGTVTVHDESDLAPLAGVSCIDGDLIIANTTLSAMAELQGLTTVTGSVVVAGNENLTNVDDLRGLREIGLTYLIQGNDNLTNVGGISVVERVRSFSIIGNAMLPDLSGLESWTRLTADLNVTGNSALTSLHGLENLLSCSQSISIRSNRNLTSLAALDNLHAVEQLYIVGNAALPTINMQNLERADVRVWVNSNAGLTSATFPRLSTLADSIMFGSNPALVTVDLPNVLLTGHFIADNAASLTTIHAPKLSFATANVELTAVPNLANVDFSALTSIGGNLLVQNAPRLADFTGFPLVSSIGGYMKILNAGALTNFTGLESLTGVYGDMVIGSNASLTSFQGLSAFTHVDGNLTITSNSALAPSTAQAFASSITVKGSVTIN